MFKTLSNLLFFISVLVTQHTMAQPVSVKILPLGDSITAGIGPDLPAKALPSYRRSLWHKLNNAGFKIDFVGNKHHFADIETLDDNLKDFSPLYEGYAGITAEEINTDPDGQGYKMSTLMEDGKYIPDIALIHLGSNDLLQNRPSDQTLTALKGIIIQLRNKNPLINILIAKIIPLHPYEAPEAEISGSLNNLLTQSWASKLSTLQSQVKIVDLNTNYPVKDGYWDEGIHPSAKGEVFMAQQWFDALKTLPIMQTNRIKITLKKPPITQALTLHLDASDINADGIQDYIQAISSETLLTQWNDKSDKHNDMMSINASGPLRLKNTLNNKPSVAFKRSGLQTTNNKQITPNSAYTKFVVFRFNNNNQANHLLSSITDYKGKGTSLWGSSKTGVSVQHDDNTTNFIQTKNLSTGFHIVSFRYAPNQFGNLINLDGVTQQLNNDIHPHQAAATTLGFFNDEYLDGGIAEAIIYDKGLNNTEIQQTERYLARKWKLKLKIMNSLERAKIEIIEDIIGNFDKKPASTEQINLFLSAQLAKKETNYSFALKSGTYKDPNNPTKDEIKKVIIQTNRLSDKANAGNNKETAGSLSQFLLLTLALAMIYRRFFNQHLTRKYDKVASL